MGEHGLCKAGVEGTSPFRSIAVTASARVAVGRTACRRDRKGKVAALGCALYGRASRHDLNPLLTQLAGPDAASPTLAAGGFAE